MTFGTTEGTRTMPTITTTDLAALVAAEREAADRYRVASRAIVLKSMRA